MPRTRPPYDEEFRREAVGLLARGERSLAALSKELGVSQQTLRTWRKRAGVEAGKVEGLTRDEREELRRVKRELRVVTEEREILKKALAFFAKDDRRLLFSGLSRRRRRITPSRRSAGCWGCRARGTTRGRLAGRLCARSRTRR